MNKLIIVLCVLVFLPLVGQTASRVDFMEAYIVKYGRFEVVDGPGVLVAHKNEVSPDYPRYVAEIFESAGVEFDVDPLVFLAMSRWETHYRTWCRGDNGQAQGLLQVRQDHHRVRFKGGWTNRRGIHRDISSEVTHNGELMNFIWGDDLDMVRYAAWHVRRDLDAGRSLYSACGWWSVRSNGCEAWGEYLRLKKEPK